MTATNININGPSLISFDFLNIDDIVLQISKFYSLFFREEDAVKLNEITSDLHLNIEGDG